MGWYNSFIFLCIAFKLFSINLMYVVDYNDSFFRKKFECSQRYDHLRFFRKRAIFVSFTSRKDENNIEVFFCIRENYKKLIASLSSTVKSIISYENNITFMHTCVLM